VAAIMFQALRVRDFRLIWAGGLVSALGSWLLTLAIPTHIFLVTGSLRATGLTVAAEYLPLLLLGPVAGVFADRWDRRRLMIGTNLFCAAAVAVMLLGLAPGRYGVLYAALVAENAGVVLYAPAWQARTPAVVGTGSLLSSANALNAASSGVVRLVGGPLGGVLLALCGARWLIGIDTASYLLSALALALTSRTPVASATCSRGHASCAASRSRGRCSRSRSSTWPPTPRSARCSSCSGSSGSAAASPPGSCWRAWARASWPAPRSSACCWTGSSPGSCWPPRWPPTPPPTSACSPRPRWPRRCPRPPPSACSARCRW
jgi:MFS family permease